MNDKKQARLDQAVQAGGSGPMRLSFERLRLSVSDLKVILATIQNCPHITDLWLEYCNCGDEGAKEIAKQLGNTFVTRLCLRYNGIGVAGCAGKQKNDLEENSETS